MRLREFIRLASGAVAAWPLTPFGKAQHIAIFSSVFPTTEMVETSGDFGRFSKNSVARGVSRATICLVERYGRAWHYPDLIRQVVGRNPELIVVIGANDLSL